MNTLIIGLIIVINFILESAVFPNFKIFGILPNTGLIIIVAIALLKGRKTGSIVGLIIGLLQDVIFSRVIGVNGFLYFFIGYFIGMAESKLSKDNILIPFIITLGSTIGYHAFYYLFMFFLNYSTNFPVFFKKVVLFEMIYNGIIAVFIYKWFSKIFVAPSAMFRRR